MRQHGIDLDALSNHLGRNSLRESSILQSQENEPDIKTPYQ